MEWTQIAITALISALVLLVEDYLPWQAWRIQLSLVVRYVLGVLALVLPLSGLLIIWQQIIVLAALWCVVCAGGISVAGAYALDGWQVLHQRVHAAELEAQLLRPEVPHAEIERN